MVQRPAKHGDRRRSGFTLLELMIVLAIMVMLVGVSWPRMRTTLEKAELTSAAKEVRTLLSHGRLDAIGFGEPRQFRYQPGGTLYEVGPYSAADEGSPVAAVLPTAKLPAIQASLPQGLRFVAPPSTELEDQPAATDEWSKPVLLYPNGRSGNARFRVAGKNNMFVEIVLRGITGVAKVGPIQREVQEP